ncbi:MAG: insulinase family protein, partial [Chloroflexi bacterium]|nr:insulinase family protein [Chloroflexota bacterium]
AVELPRVYIGCRVPPYGTRDWYALDLLASALSEGKATPLYRDLVYERQAAQDVSAALLAGDGRIVAQADQQPLQGLAPTNLWQPGDVVRDPYQIELPPELPAGMYTLQTGMYLRETGARLPVVGEQASGDTIFLETLGWPPG